jgi:quercetin dioxygenase-like cupin family protein
MHDGKEMKKEKPWGHEIIWALTDKYAGKILSIKGGKRLSLQYHEKKDETVYVLWGKMELQLGENKTVLLPGDFRRIKAGQVHRMTAITDVICIEASTPEVDDVVRLEDDYNRLDSN